MGYHLAGFEVVGVDIEPQPNYPFKFVQADALSFPLDGFAAAHASPPCQPHSALAVMPNAGTHVDLLPATRQWLDQSQLPYVIENVVGAPLHSPVMLCGASFGLGTSTHDLARHRLFECNFPVMVPPCAHGGRRVIGLYGDHARIDRRHGLRSQYNAVDSLRYGKEAMRIDWMTWKELVQAIPPVFTEHIGSYLMAEVVARGQRAPGSLAVRSYPQS